MKRLLQIFVLLSFSYTLIACVSPTAFQRLKKENAKQAALIDEFVIENDQLRTRLEVLAGQVRGFKLERQTIQGSEELLTLREQALLEREQEISAMQAVLAQPVEPVEPVATPTPAFEVNPDTGGIVLAADVVFAPGRAALSTAGAALVARLAGEVAKEQYQDYRLEIAGHTDGDPIKKSSWEDNWQLSAERARTVLNGLEQAGIDAERLYLAGYGSQRPVAGDKKQQRRVEVVLVKR